MPAKDLEAFLLPWASIFQRRFAAGGHTEFQSQSVRSDQQLVITGNVGLFNGVLAGFDLGSKMSSVASLAESKRARI